MSDYRDLCEMFNLGVNDPDAIDKIIDMVNIGDDEDDFEFFEDYEEWDEDFDEDEDEDE